MPPGGRAERRSTSPDPVETSSLEPAGTSGRDEFLQSSNGRYRLYETPEGAPGLYQKGTDGLWWLLEGSDSLATVPGVPTFFCGPLHGGRGPSSPARS